jgi:DnaJ-class molecular chaperone
LRKDFYAVLGLGRSATTKEVRARFIELARDRHPDRFQGAEKAKAETDFQQITEAFNVLSHAERRRQHDLELSRPEASAQGVYEPKQLAKVYAQRGAASYHAGRFPEAVEFFQRATRLEAQNAAHWHSLALAYVGLDRAYASQDRAQRGQDRPLTKAMNAIARACELDRINAKYLKLAGRLFAEGGMPRRAERYYRDALQWVSEEDPEILAALKQL